MQILPRTAAATTTPIIAPWFMHQTYLRLVRPQQLNHIPVGLTQK